MQIALALPHKRVQRLFISGKAHGAAFSRKRPQDLEQDSGFGGGLTVIATLVGKGAICGCSWSKYDQDVEKSLSVCAPELELSTVCVMGGCQMPANGNQQSEIR